MRYLLLFTVIYNADDQYTGCDVDENTEDALSPSAHTASSATSASDGVQGGSSPLRVEAYPAGSPYGSQARGSETSAPGGSIGASSRADASVRPGDPGSSARGASSDDTPCRLVEQFNGACTSSRESAPAHGGHQRDPAAEPPGRIVQAQAGLSASPRGQWTDDHGVGDVSLARSILPGRASPACGDAANGASPPTAQEQRRRPPTLEKL
jgi:hypothetical protein